MEIYKKYDDRRIKSKGSKHAVITLVYNTGEYYHIYTKDHVKGLALHLSTLRRRHRVNKKFLSAYSKAESVLCTITHFDDKKAAHAHLAKAHEHFDERCLSNVHRVIHKPNKPGAYTIHMGEYFYHGYSSKLNFRLSEHLKKLKWGKSDNPGLQKMYDVGHVPRFTIYICADVESAKNLEYKMIREDLYNPKLLNVITYENK